MASATVANANPTSMPLTAGAAARAGAGAGRAGAAGGAGAAGFAGAAGAAAGAGAAGAATEAAAAGAGAAGAGILIEGPPAGLGGRLMRTVCFLAAASAGLGGSGAGAGGTGELGSAIGNLLADATEPQKSSQTVYSREHKKTDPLGRNPHDRTLASFPTERRQRRNHGGSDSPLPPACGPNPPRILSRPPSPRRGALTRLQFPPPLRSQRSRRAEARKLGRSNERETGQERTQRRPRSSPETPRDWS